MRIGIVGAGQLARMLLEDASALGLDCVVLAESEQDAAAITAHSVILGTPHDADALERLAEAVDVITFDHELVNLELLASLEARGVAVAPPTSALLYAVDKAEMRIALAAQGLPIPRFEVFHPGSSFDARLAGDTFGWPLVIKSARGGYDGRGVFVVDNAQVAQDVVAELHDSGVTALLEEHIEIRAELAALVCRSDDGVVVSWPVVETAQIDGVCREVLVPGTLSAEHRSDGERLARLIAEAINVVGVMAVELFVTGSGLMINELAMRPHNSGHWTQDGAVTSQFENHLRAVAGLPLGETSMTAETVASVNVFGGDQALDPFNSLTQALSVPGAHVHLYGKVPRKGRKLGHVTVTGQNADEARSRAWQAGGALGTPRPDALGRGAP